MNQGVVNVVWAISVFGTVCTQVVWRVGLAESKQYMIIIMYIPCSTHNINHCRSLKVKSNKTNESDIPLFPYLELHELIHTDTEIAKTTSTTPQSHWIDSADSFKTLIKANNDGSDNELLCFTFRS